MNANGLSDLSVANGYVYAALSAPKVKDGELYFSISIPDWSPESFLIRLDDIDSLEIRQHATWKSYANPQCVLKLRMKCNVLAKEVHELKPNNWRFL